MSLLSSRIARALAASSVIVAVIAACGSESTSNFPDGTKDGGPSGTSGTNNSSGNIIGGGDGGSSGDTDGGDPNIDPNCKALTCADQNIGCGLAGDGCGRQINCDPPGGCGEGKRCGGPGAPSQCVTIQVATECTPKTCGEFNIGCGQAGDGCGNTINCGGCAADEQCGAVGRPSQCVKIEATQPDGGACIPKTVAQFNAEFKDCGEQSDGCGGTVQLGSCVAPEFCGGGGPSKCAVSGGGTCTKKTCADYPSTICGAQPDGCGGVTAVCGAACVLPQVCGGGGIPSQCGGGTLTQDGGGACVPRTCAAGQCGQISDGCGGVVDCGNAACTNGNFCGGGGTPNQCGKPACTPLTQAAACSGGKNCGVVGDGCGGTITCGPATCAVAGQVCGANNTPNVCGGGSVTADGGPGGGPCVPVTAASPGACPAGRCGPIANGCGGTYTCGTGPTFCPAGEVCGAVTPSQCSANTCTPIPQATACAGKNCGQVPNGCGGVHLCGVGTGNCPDVPVAGGVRRGDICGGAVAPATGTPNVCGGGSSCAAGSLCNQQPTTCAGGVNTTAVEGVVYMPNGYLPVYDALVYVPDATLPTIPTGQNGTCTACAGATATSPLVLTRTDYRGYFRLERMPAGNNIPIVIQSGKWRKNITVNTTACNTLTLNTVPAGACPQCNSAATCGGADVPTGTRVCQVATTNNTTFGRTQSANNNIPKFAVVTGGADALQCLLRKIGIADTEFVQPASTGRVNIYANNANDDASDRYRNGFNGMSGTGAWTAATTTGTRNMPDETVLYGNNATGTADLTQFNRYDAVVLSCNGSGNERQDTLGGYRDDMKAYADIGGRIFATHWHYAWLKHGPGTWGSTDPVTNTPTGKVATISSSDEDLVDPIDATINGATTAGSRGSNFADWLLAANTYAATAARPRGQLRILDAQHNVFSVDTTRADAHFSIAAPMSIETPVCSGGTRNGSNCNNCPNSSCNTGTGLCNGGTRGGQACVNCPNGTCRTTSPSPSVQQFSFNTPLAASGVPATQCGKMVISDIHVARDSVGNGSGGNDSGFPNNCTSTGMTDQERALAFEIFNLTSCGTPPPNTTPTCTPRDCSHPTNAGKCGRQPNGCGGLTAQDCQPCTSPDTCGGGGINDQCGHTDCTPTACPANTCSTTGGVPDGCGGLAPCAPCPAGQTCGGGGQANRCGTPTCTPRTCAQLAAANPPFECGQTGDGCGGTLNCACPAGETCGASNTPGGQGTPNICGRCVPRTTCPAGLNCGRWPDGCGGSIQCGTCPDGSACGGGGQANVCGQGSCVAKNCVELGAQCGQVSDGCGGINTCATCAQDSFCNATNLCVPPTCQPKTCQQQGIECGPSGDTCGGFIANCGDCPAGTGCGAGGVPGKCGTVPCTPLTCQQANAVCGQVANGCGGLTTNCGSCPGTQSCVNGACVNACTPRTCAEAGAECGFIGDGCGGALDCGVCTGGKVCGFNNQANKCGAEGPR